MMMALDCAAKSAQQEAERLRALVKDLQDEARHQISHAMKASSDRARDAMKAALAEKKRETDTPVEGGAAVYFLLEVADQKREAAEAAAAAVHAADEASCAAIHAQSEAEEATYADRTLLAKPDKVRIS